MPFEEYFAKSTDYMPWYTLSEEEKAEQLEWQAALTRHYGARFGSGVFVSKFAKLYGINALAVGDGSFFAADCLVREVWLTMGKNSSVNSGCYLQGRLSIGNDVRLAPGAQLIGMNHNMGDPTRPITEQGLSHKGITVEDDVWVGANATVVDGVTIGAHSVIGAGAVVTKDIPPYSVAVGNPAWPVRDRRAAQPPVQDPTGPLEKRLIALSEKAHKQLPELLRYYAIDGDMRNSPAEGPTTRAWCDTVELMAMLGQLPPIKQRDALVRRLHALQKTSVDYDTLTVGYALEVLGAAPIKPFEEAASIGERLEQWLEERPWNTDAWGAGADVDHLVTAFYLNQRWFGFTPPIHTLLEWLEQHQDAVTGLWGAGREGDLHLPVNGYYRLTRGSFAQFGVPVPNPEKTIDSILAQAARPEYFGSGKGNACDVLDIVHPLWLCAKQTGHRREEGMAWVSRLLPRILSVWQEGRGFAFELSATAEATLQGTEMWLSILWLACDYLGMAHLLGYMPKGVHRPHPALLLDDRSASCL